MATYAPPTTHRSSTSVRRLYAVLAASLVALVTARLVRDGGGYWQLGAFGLGPDVALVLGFGSSLAKGQLHPRAVPAYNLLHRFAGPLVLGVLALAGVLPANLLVGALAWAFHVALDRSLGYGLRTRDGLQRA
jgi:hypothetical protein